MEGEELGVTKEGIPGTERGRSLPQLGRAADGGNCDHTQTRTHARTPDATRRSACAQAWKLRPLYALSPPQYRAKSRRGSPAPALTIVRTRTFYFTHFFAFLPFPSYRVELGMRTSCPPGLPGFSRPSLASGGRSEFTPLSGDTCSKPGMGETSRRRVSFWS